MNIKLFRLIHWSITALACLFLSLLAIRAELDVDTTEGLVIGIILISTGIGTAIERLVVYRVKRRAVPILREKYFESSKALIPIYQQLSMNRTAYLKNIDSLDLTIEKQDSITAEMIRRPVLCVIKHSQVLNDMDCVNKLQQCIAYLELKEELIQQLDVLGKNISSNLTAKERQTCDTREWACEVASVDQTYIEPEYFCVYDSNVEDLSISWPLTSNNLKTLLQTLQLNDYREQRNLPKGVYIR